MLIGERGRRVKDLAEAEAFIREFVAYGQEERDESGPQHRHSRDYDLYLPWLWENVSNARAEDPPLEGIVLERMYMEAAWNLVRRGVLRPGPKTVMGGGGGADFGKGYSLTHEGDEWLGSESEPTERSLR
ncbi:hypothetical protein BH11ARM2_BH11ARM2_01900 [soil metagenome]